MLEMLEAIKVEGISWDERLRSATYLRPVASFYAMCITNTTWMNDRSIVDQYIYLVKGAVFFTFLN